ncbi:MAG: histidinol-phosphate transaminase [Candidatus Roizmanbacteria bacterium]|nr:histidinol-phosphate transaminase [Candidatus Roizmanbacteria bacterium]
MNIPNKFLSSVAQKITPYEWALNVPENVLRFDTNTLPYPPPCVKGFCKSLMNNCPINEYGDSSYSKLKTFIAAYENVGTNEITITNSGDEALDIVTKAFLDLDDQFIIQPPTYEMFRIQAEINHGKCIEIPLTAQFEIDTTVLLKTIRKIEPKITFVCNPNNPSGTVTTNETIELILKKSNGIVLVDEAYREFYGKTSASLLKKYDNLIILRSFSKFGAMAGARIGYLMASSKLSQVFDAIRLPMGVSWFSYKFAELLLEKNTAWIKSQSQMIIRERSQLTKELTELGLNVVPSQANFLLVKVGDKAKELYEKLKDNNILVRDRSNKPYLEGCLRVTVRNREQNNQLIKSLRNII